MKGNTVIADARAQTRNDISVDVLVAVKNQPLMTLKTGNMTDRGVFLLSNNCPLPPVGTEVILTIEEFLHQPDPIAMTGRVIHKNEHGMGVELLGPVT